MKVSPMPKPTTLQEQGDCKKFRSPKCRDSVSLYATLKQQDSAEKRCFENSRFEEFLTPAAAVQVMQEVEETKEEESVMCPRRESFEDQALSLARPKRKTLKKPDSTSRLPCPGAEARRCISFESVTLREYSMIMGDNPSCDDGLPLTIGWDYIEYKPLSVDDYEFHHARRRPLKELAFSFQKRRRIILASLESSKQPSETKSSFRMKLKKLLRTIVS